MRIAQLNAIKCYKKKLLCWMAGVAQKSVFSLTAIESPQQVRGIQ